MTAFMVALLAFVLAVFLKNKYIKVALFVAVAMLIAQLQLTF